MICPSYPHFLGTSCILHGYKLQILMVKMLVSVSSWGYPQSSSIFMGMFHYKPTITWGIPMETSESKKPTGEKCSQRPPQRLGSHGQTCSWNDLRNCLGSSNKKGEINNTKNIMLGKKKLLETRKIDEYIYIYIYIYTYIYIYIWISCFFQGRHQALCAENGWKWWMFVALRFCKATKLLEKTRFTTILLCYYCVIQQTYEPMSWEIMWIYTGWWLGHPSEKYERQLGWWDSNIWENKKCSKPPTSIDWSKKRRNWPFIEHVQPTHNHRWCPIQIWKFAREPCLTRKYPTYCQELVRCQTTGIWCVFGRGKFWSFETCCSCRVDQKSNFRKDWQ